MSFDLILPYVRPLTALISDPGVTEIMVNSGGTVFIEREGRLLPVEGVCIGERQRQAAVRNIARLLGDNIDEQRPLLDARRRTDPVWPR